MLYHHLLAPEAPIDVVKRLSRRGSLYVVLLPAEESWSID